MPGDLKRILIPIDATEKFRCGLLYARRLAESGDQLEVILLFVAEPVNAWQVLRFYSPSEVRKHFQERSAIFLNEAAQLFSDAGIPCQICFREDVEAENGIIQAADEMNCSEIVVPSSRWFGLFSKGLGAKQNQMSRHFSIRRVHADGSVDS